MRLLFIFSVGMDTIHMCAGKFALSEGTSHTKFMLCVINHVALHLDSDTVNKMKILLRNILKLKMTTFPVDLK